jgi:hypothetical protein
MANAKQPPVPPDDEARLTREEDGQWSVRWTTHHRRFGSRGEAIEWCLSRKLRIRMMPLGKRAKLNPVPNKLKRKSKMLKQVMRGPVKSNSTYYTTAGVRPSLARGILA